MTTIWTIGHSTRSSEDFVALLREHEIDQVADVRRFPGSRHVPQFNEADLRGTLEAAGIRYVHLPELGGRRPVRPDSRNLNWRNAAFRGYADYMETPEFQAGLDRLIKQAGSGRTVIMCAEAVWWRCHRSLIADRLRSIGMRVIHILAPGDAEEHPYTPAARFVDGKLTYAPAPAASARPLKEAPARRGFRVGDHVEWNSEAGRVRGTIKKKITAPMEFKGYTVRASKESPQYLIQSDKTDHLAMHKGTALTRIPRGRRVLPLKTSP